MAAHVSELCKGHSRSLKGANEQKKNFVDKLPFSNRLAQHALKLLARISLQDVCSRGEVEDTRLEAKAKDTKKIRGQAQGQPFRGQTLSRPRTGMLEAKAKDTSASALQKKKVFTKIF